MSSTNRGSTRAKDDFYETPSWCIDAILPHLPLSGRLLDPCAGQGAILNACRTSFLSRFAIEINPEFGSPETRFYASRWDTCDALGTDAEWCGDVVLMNPPFDKKELFIQRSITEMKPKNGTTCVLLSLSFMAAQKRRDFLIANPCDIAVLPRRPSFSLNKDGKKGSDSCEYGWFIWAPGRGGRWWRL